jgi:hypothetical protein
MIFLYKSGHSPRWGESPHNGRQNNNKNSIDNNNTLFLTIDNKVPYLHIKFEFQLL